MASMEYKGFIATIDYDSDLDSFCGNVINVSSPIMFYGKTTEELHQEFANSVDTWLAVCAERGIKPEMPYSGSLTIKMSPEIHRDISIAAAHAGKSIDVRVADSLRSMARMD